MYEAKEVKPQTTPPKSSLSRAAKRRARYRKKKSNLISSGVTPSINVVPSDERDIEALSTVSKVYEPEHASNNEVTGSSGFSAVLSDYGPSAISAFLRLPHNLIGVVPGFFWSFTFWDLLQGGPDVIPTSVKLEMGAAVSAFTSLAYLRQYLEGLRGEQNKELAHLIVRLEKLLKSLQLKNEYAPTKQYIEREISSITSELLDIKSTDSLAKKIRDSILITLDTIKNQGGAALVCVLLIHYFFKAVDDPYTAICFYGGLGYGAVNGIYEAYKSVGTTYKQTKKVNALTEQADLILNPQQAALLSSESDKENLPLIQRLSTAAEPSSFSSLFSKVEPVWNFIRGISYDVAEVVPFAFWIQNFLGVMTEHAASSLQSKVTFGPIAAAVSTFGLWAQQIGNRREGQNQKLQELIAQLDVLLEKREEGAFDQFVSEINDIQTQLNEIKATDSNTKQTIDRLVLLCDGFKNYTGSCLVVLLCIDFFISSLAPTWKHWAGAGAAGVFGIIDAFLSRSSVAEVKKLEEETERLIGVLRGTATGNTTPRGTEY